MVISRRQWKFIACIFLILATLIVFWGVKDNQFIHYDDDIYIINNPPVRAGLTLLIMLIQK
jgi:hypothetical protein